MSLAVVHDVEENKFYHIFKNHIEKKVVQFEIPKSNSFVDIFSYALGEKAMPHATSVLFISMRDESCLEDKIRRMQRQYLETHQLFAHFYYLQINLSFIFETEFKCKGSRSFYDGKLVQHIPKSTYKELFFQYQQANMQTT